jgi:cyclase
VGRVLASRIVSVILMRGRQVVRGRSYGEYDVRCDLLSTVRLYERRNIDEVVLLDIGATPGGSEPNVSLIREFAGSMFCPVTVGGGVRTLEHFKQLLANGADKVAINTAAVETPKLITKAAEKFGRQAVVVSIDVKDGHVQTHCGTRGTALRPVEWARECERRGAGELLLTCVDRDGTLSGYDTDLIRSVAEVVGIPVVACGGAGTYEHLKEGLDAGAHAVAAGAMWTFCDFTPAGAAEYLHKAGVRVRRKIAA